MVKKKYLILTLMLSLLGINKTYAACTQEEIDAFKKIENKYKVTYKFDKDTQKYTLLFKSPQPEKYHYIIYTDDELKCNTKDDITMECIEFKPDLYTIKIVGMTKNCDDTLKSFTLDLTKYNNFANDPLCEGIEEFVLCNPSYNKEIDYETFVSRVKTYKKTKKEKETEKQNIVQEENVFGNQIKDYINNNILQIIVITIFIILVIITMTISIKSARKSRRLE